MKLRSKQHAGSRNILNPEREYVPAAQTDVAATFARYRARLEAEAKESHVIKMERRKK